LRLFEGTARNELLDLEIMLDEAIVEQQFLLNDDGFDLVAGQIRHQGIGQRVAVSLARDLFRGARFRSDDAKGFVTMRLWPMRRLRSRRPAIAPPLALDQPSTRGQCKRSGVVDSQGTVRVLAEINQYSGAEKGPDVGGVRTLTENRVKPLVEQVCGPAWRPGV
jgi:hypothetical protein